MAVSSLPAAVVRALAVAAQTDPRTIQRVFTGRSVRGSAGVRARLALIRAGLLDETPSDRVHKLTFEASANP